MSVASPQGRPLVAWYGDDFTGSAAVLETLTTAGLEGVLFLITPTPDDVEAFPGVTGVGIAGMSRTWSPGRMRAELPEQFAALDATGAPILHYKICSTFDSSPQAGSIGVAIDLAFTQLGVEWCPVFPASLAVGRYQAFGNLFARNGATRFRLDRHPVMMRHPVTPMNEADVRLHLACQSRREIVLIDLTELSVASERLRTLVGAGVSIVAIDTVDDDDLVHVGRLLWEERRDRLFCVGSQGIEEALVAHFRAGGMLPPAAPALEFPSAGRVLGLSASVSQVTHQQLQQAGASGFHLIPLDLAGCIADPDRAVEGAVDEVTACLASRASPLVYTSLGPDDPAIAAFRDRADAAALGTGEAADRLGQCLGRVAAGVRDRVDLDRIVVAGGDTSGHVCRELGIEALTMAGTSVAGAALFEARSRRGASQGYSIALKGGQMGTPDYFAWMRDGRRPS
jgi:uncharacterized protein YgbK (DUF1537 family)